MPGILTLEKKYGRDRLVAACACADQKLQYGGDIRPCARCLNWEDADFFPDEDGEYSPTTSPAPLTHKNIRGREYYRKDKQ